MDIEKLKNYITEMVMDMEMERKNMTKDEIKFLKKFNYQTILDNDPALEDLIDLFKPYSISIEPKLAKEILETGRKLFLKIIES